MEKNELISYALSFSAFLLKDKSMHDGISKIILFGSIARGDFDKESDIDIFIETKLPEKLIQKQLDLFNKSKIKELYSFKGISNDIVLKIGNLNTWKGLKESIAEDGLVLYGKYEESPKGLEHFTIFKISVEKKKFSSKVKIWRRIYGYKQKVNKKIYSSKGLLEELDGLRLSKGVFIAPFHFRQKVIDFLDKNKIRYQMHDIYKSKNE